MIGRAASLAVLVAAPVSADIIESAFDSSTLGRPMEISVYTPPDYQSDGPALPVFYLLHGLGDNHRAWTNAGIETIVDNAIAEGAAPHLVVMPNAGQSWYADADLPGGPGNLHAAIRDDLVAHVDATWSTDPVSTARAIGGHSMGAQGALSIAFDAPDVFGFAIAMSLSPGPRMIARLQAGETLSDERAAGWLGGAYGVPFQADLYIQDLPETRANTLEPQASPRLYLHASDDDPFDTHLRTVELYRQLRARGIEPELRITNGGHSWAVWKRELPEVVRFLSDYESWSIGSNL